MDYAWKPPLVVVEPEGMQRVGIEVYLYMLMISRFSPGTTI